MTRPLPAGAYSAKASPPMPVDCGSMTPRRAAAVTAASAAVPPARSVSIAARLASGLEVAAMPASAWTVERPGALKSRMGEDRLSVFESTGIATLSVMPALVAGIHVFAATPASEDVDGRDKPGHD